MRLHSLSIEWPTGKEWNCASKCWSDRKDHSPLLHCWVLISTPPFKQGYLNAAFMLLFSSQIFDHFVLRISDSHKKVKQKALDMLAEIIGILEDALNPVIVGLVEGITTNLNSKDPGVRTAAVKALEESIAHLGKADPWHGLSSTVSLPLGHKRTLSALTAVGVCAMPQLTSTRSSAGALLTHQPPNGLECASAFPKSPRSPWLCAACLKRRSWTTALPEFRGKGVLEFAWAPFDFPNEQLCCWCEGTLAHQSFCRTASWQALHYRH